MIRLIVTGDRELIARLENMPGVAREGLREGVANASRIVEEGARAKMAALFRGPVAQISSRVEDSGTLVVGTITAGGTPYAAIHEFGGRTRPHQILPRSARVLVFQSREGNTVFARRVNHPGSKIPERSYLRSALADAKGEIVAAIEAAVLVRVKRAA